MKEVSIVYYSQTGQTQRFIEKLGESLEGDFTYVRLTEGDEKVEEQYILITPTYHFGEVPDVVDEFLESNHTNLLAVVSSGNLNWGKDIFGKAGEIISKEYNVPWLHKFEMRGTASDVDAVKSGIIEVISKS